MRRSHLITLGVFALMLLLPQATHAASGFFGPIVPTSGECTCAGSAPDWGCVLQLMQNIMNFVVTMATIALTVFIALAGFAYMTSGANPEKRSAATQRVTNAVLGLLILFSAYLVVDSIMKVLYKGSDPQNSSQFGPWNSILVGNGKDYCITPVGNATLGDAFGTAANTPTANTSGTGGIVTGTGACSASTVMADASAGGYQISQSEANTLACLAKPESACGTNTSGAKTTSGKSTSASGPWQILVGAKDACHSLNIPACGNLNCSAAYSKGVVKSDAASQALAQQCQAEVNNLACSAAAAACIVKADGGYTAWTADSRSSAQKSCIQQYAI